jgi:hypothetical protein
MLYESPPSPGKIKSEAIRSCENGIASPITYLLRKSFMSSSMKMEYGSYIPLKPNPKFG